MSPSTYEKEKLNRAANSEPINKTAALVTKPGIHYDFICKKKGMHSKEPLAIGPITSCERRSIGFVNYTNYKYGWFTVIGKSATTKKMWVVKCSCGNYEHRSVRAMTNPRNQNDKCEECCRLESLKQKNSREALLTEIRNDNDQMQKEISSVNAILVALDANLSIEEVNSLLIAIKQFRGVTSAIRHII